ncbi:hypothetical protein EYC80_007822 [Monilinia laxa]|uniref:Prenylcysteine lyase domain-containing protein n=1 Tax=Monilinia laxa TaxID=61186 RepID=A0A5N6JUH4_MONLA|nr:hypothetical protein EYC80_007822 [Monilinia laxa]
MTNKTYTSLPPPPYTSQAPPEYSENSPLISNSFEYPRSDSRTGRDKNAKVFLTTLLALTATLLTAGIIIGLEIFLPSINSPHPEIEVVEIKVGIVGAGPAGIAAARGVRNEILTHAAILRDQNLDLNVEIIIYEQKTRIGGRMTVEDTSPMVIEVEDVAGGAFDGDLLETIGGVLEEKQESVMSQGEELGVGKVAFFDPTHIIAETYRPYTTTPWSRYLSLLIKYGTSIWRAPKVPMGTMNSFNSFLRTMAATNPSTGSVQEMIRVMSKQYTWVPFSIPASNRLEMNGIGDNYVRDILAPQVRRHTGQSIEDLSDLALSMALEREEIGCQKPANSGVFQMMMDNALKDSGAKLRVSSKVTKVLWEEITEGYENWILQWEDVLDHEVPSNAEVLDKIIIASPSNYSGLLGHMDNQEQFTSYNIEHDIEYQPVYVTFFLAPSPISSSLLNSGSSLPAQLLPVINPHDPKDPAFDSIIELSLLRSIVGYDSSTKYMYRLLSSQPVTNVSLVTSLGITEDITESWTQHKIPYAYPLMQALPPKEIKGDFQLGKNIWTTNGAEGPLGSSVELAWTMGENVGRLLYLDYHDFAKYHVAVHDYQKKSSPS